MKRLIQDFPKHLREALAIAEKAQLRNNGKRPANVLITGLGGSGIGGTIVADLCADTARIPIAVNKGYNVPHWVGTDTLVIASSYSGNTEETLEACSQALEYGASLCGITSGGGLKALCEERGLNYIAIPPGNPPRSMLGYSMVQLFRFLSHYGIQTPEWEEELKAAADFLESESEAIQAEAAELAEQLADRTVAFYASKGLAGVATRWRQQFNENAKTLGWDSAVPEMNHNELVGWAGGSNAMAAVFLESEDDYRRNAFRMEKNAEIISRYTDTVLRVSARGETRLARAMYLIHLGDWVSLLLAEQKGCDIMDIEVIEGLKAELSQFD